MASNQSYSTFFQQQVSFRRLPQLTPNRNITSQPTLSSGRMTSNGNPTMAWTTPTFPHLPSPCVVPTLPLTILLNLFDPLLLMTFLHTQPMLQDVSGIRKQRRESSTDGQWYCTRLSKWDSSRRQNSQIIPKKWHVTRDEMCWKCVFYCMIHSQCDKNDERRRETLTREKASCRVSPTTSFCSLPPSWRLVGTTNLPGVSSSTPVRLPVDAAIVEHLVVIRTQPKSRCCVVRFVLLLGESGIWNLSVRKSTQSAQVNKSWQLCQSPRWTIVRAYALMARQFRHFFTHPQTNNNTPTKQWRWIRPAPVTRR